MAFVGDLGSVDLGQVFQVLSQNQRDGVLDVFRGESHRGLRVRRGAISLQFDRDVYEERVIELLRSLGRISEEKLRLAVANRSGTDADLLEVLVKMQLLSPEEVTTLFRERMAEELYELFSWGDARFEFHDGARLLEGVAGEVDDKLFFPADAVIMEAARRLDEWNEIRARVPDPGAVLAPLVEEFTPEDELQERVFQLVDGARSAAEITRQLGRSSFEVSKTIARLTDLGAIASVPPEDYPSRARAALTAGRAEDAANLFDRSAAASVEVPETIGEAGKAYEAARQPSLAAERFVAFGDALVDRGRADDALRAYRHAHALVPTHLDAWKKAVFLALELEEKQPGRSVSRGWAAEHGHELAEVLQELGQSTLGCEVLERILARNPGDLETKRALVAVLDREGNSERLCEVLEGVASDLSKSGDASGAAAALQRVMRMHPERRDLSAKIKEQYKRDERKRHGRRAAVVGLISTVLAGAIGTLVYSRETTAQVELSALRIEEKTAAGDYAGARGILEEFRASHPFTFASARAKEHVARVDQLIEEAQAQEGRRKEEEQAARDKRISEAGDLVGLADAKARSGDLKGALAQMRRALSLAPPDWDKAEAARKNADDLESYLRGAADTAKRAERYAGSGELAEARRTVHELVTRYGLSTEARVATYPFLIKTDPAGAEVEIAGKVVGKTPGVVRVPASRKSFDVRIRMRGFAPIDVKLDPDAPGPIDLRLGRAPETVATLASPASSPLSVRGRYAWFALGGGQLARIPEKATAAAVASLSARGEIAGGPIEAEGRVLAAATDGVVACFDPASGERLWRIQLPDGVRMQPAASSDGVLVTTDDGKLRLLKVASGEVVREWRAGPRASSPPLPCGDVVAFGTGDGRVRVVELKNPKAEDKWLILGAPVCALSCATLAPAAGGRVVLAACDDGRLAAFELPSGKPVFTLPGGRVTSPRPVVARGRFLVEYGGKLVALDPRTGSVLASAALRAETEGAPAVVGGRVYAALRGGGVAALRADDLSVAWQWPGLEGSASISAAEGELLVTTGKSLLRFDLRLESRGEGK